MKLLVLGASGFIGGYLIEEAKKKGIDCIGTDRSNSSGKTVKFDFKTDDVKNIIQTHFSGGGDLGNAAVICAAISKIDLCKTDYDKSYLINVSKTKEIMSALSEHRFKTVFISTDNVFSGEKGYYSEEEEAVPLNEYGRQKKEAEEHLLSLGKNNLVIRLSKIVSHKRNEPQPFDEWYTSATSGKPIRSIRGNIFSPTYVVDAAKGILTAIEKDLTGVYHLCNNEHFSRNELALQFLNYFGFNVSAYEENLESFNFTDKRCLKSYMCNDRFVKATGFRFTSMKTVMEIMKNDLR